MTYLIPAQAGAQFISLVVYGLIARWYVTPWLSARKRGDALIALLWVHVFRYVALPKFSAQRDHRRRPIRNIKNSGALSKHELDPDAKEEHADNTLQPDLRSCVARRTTNYSGEQRHGDSRTQARPSLAIPLPSPWFPASDGTC
jgi:hypothetical protein